MNLMANRIQIEKSKREREKLLNEMQKILNEFH